MYQSKEQLEVPPDPQIIAAAVEADNAGDSFNGTAKQFGLNVMVFKSLCRKEDSCPALKQGRYLPKTRTKNLARF